MSGAGALADDMQKGKMAIATAEEGFSDPIPGTNAPCIDEQINGRSPESRIRQRGSKMTDEAEQLIAIHHRQSIQSVGNHDLSVGCLSIFGSESYQSHLRIV